MRKYAALIIFISFAICFPVFANSDDWTYSPPGSYEQAISISKETGEIKSHLYLGKIKFCEVDDEFFCFSSDFLKFSVPKFIKGEEMVWEKGDEKYKLIKMPVPLRLLGKKIDSYKVTHEKTGMEYFYSKKFGIVMMKMKDIVAPIFILEEDCGIAASASCK
ncbi:hypothetical protein [Delftia sp. GW456-R20]|uniref:hypothetical protein n=1 Tax=Delftia sp. GW456-R20 TaxID=1827145 RepID=UPI0012E70842|nr:hypothetical protein [Delftia sp. GW456-R20]